VYGPLADRAELSMNVITRIGKLDRKEHSPEDFLYNDASGDLLSCNVDIRPRRRLGSNQLRRSK